MLCTTALALDALMIAHPDIRTVLNAFFRRRHTFLIFFLPALLAGLLYVFCFATAEFESTSKLLVKFGADARPEITAQTGSSENTSPDVHHELVQSNVNILTSRDLSEALLKGVTIGRAYPRLIEDPPSRGTLMDAAVKHMSDDLSIKTESESDIITVGLYNPDPATAQVMLQQLLDLFIARQSEIYSNPQTGILREQAETARDRLEEAQKQLYQYKDKEGIASIEEELNLMLKERSDLAEELESKERAYAHYRGARSSQDPDVQAIKGQISTLDKQIATTVQNKAHYDDLMRDIQLDEGNYKAAQTRVEEAEANQNLNQQKITHISIIEHPTLPYKPMRPWKATIIALCLFMGLAFGTLACIIAEHIDQSFSLPEQAAGILGVPVLASFAYRMQPKQQSY